MNGVNLSKNISVIPLGIASSTGVGTTKISVIPSVDMSGYDGVLFIGTPIGAVVAGGVLQIIAKFGNTSTGTGDSAPGSSTSLTESTSVIAGSTSTVASTGTTGPVILLDVYKPNTRYVGISINRATQNSDLSVLAVRYAALKGPITQSTLFCYSSLAFAST